MLKKTISIIIVNYDITELKRFKDSHTIWRLLEERNIKIKLFEDIELHIIELPKIKQQNNETEEGLNTWLEFLSNPESEGVKMSMEKDKDLNEAYEKLEYISEDESLRRLADLRLMAILDENSKRNGMKKELEEGKKQAKKEGREKGREEGNIEAKKEIAKKIITERNGR